MFLRRDFLTGLGAMLLTSPASRAQEPEEPTFSANIKVVNILVTVRDKKGSIVTDLGKADFSIAENGRTQSIGYFSRETDLPLTLGLMVDTSLSQERVLDAERGASFRFLDQILRETKDRFFIVQFDMGVLVRQEITSSRAKLNEALAYVDTPSKSQLMLNGPGPGTVLYDAVVKESDEVMASQKGRKALIILSDGVDNGSTATLKDAVDAAQRNDTLIYGILFSDERAYGFSGAGGQGRSALSNLSKQTGGGFFEVSKKMTIDRIFAALEQELRSQYSIGYVSDQPAKFAEFRKIQVSTTSKDYRTQARDRYWAKP